MSLHIETYGNRNNPTIIFLHGISVSSWMWREQIAALKDDFYCVTVDLPGNGNSHDVEWLSFNATAAQIAALIPQYSETGRAHVTGFSLGGYVALHLLANHPQTVETMLVSGVSVMPFEKQWMWQIVFNLMTLIIKSEFMIRQNGKMMQFPPDKLSLYERDMRRMSRSMFRRANTEILTLDLIPWLQNNQRPLLAVAGTNEVDLILESTEKMAGLSHTETAYIPDGGHGWIIDHPDTFTNMLRDWVTQQQLRTIPA